MGRLKLLPALFGFSGRLSRLQFYKLILLITLVAAPVYLSFSMLFLLSWPIIAICMVPVVVLQTWVDLAILVKRLHDRGRSGWLLSLMLLLGPMGLPASELPHWYWLLAIAGFAAVFWLTIETYILAGNPGSNRFGPSPDAIDVMPEGYRAGAPYPRPVISAKAAATCVTS